MINPICLHHPSISSDTVESRDSVPCRWYAERLHPSRLQFFEKPEKRSGQTIYNGSSSRLRRFSLPFCSPCWKPKSVRNFLLSVLNSQNVLKYLVTCTVNRCLTPLDYVLTVFHLEFDTEGTGLKYPLEKRLGCTAGTMQNKCWTFVRGMPLIPIGCSPSLFKVGWNTQPYHEE